MKKLLLGCLVILILGVVAAVVGSYFLYRAASPLIQDARDYVQGMSELDDLERKISNQSSYTPPASGELTDSQVARFVRVQEQVRTQLGQRFAQIEERYRYLKDGAPQNDVPITELLGSLRDITGVYVDARRYQVEALNNQTFSQDEYSWVRDRVFQAAGVEIGSRIDLGKLQDAIRERTGVEGIRAEKLPMREVPAKNRALVKPYVARMDEWLPLVFFGL